MPRSRPPYSPEYRQQMVDLVRGGGDKGDDHSNLESSLLQI